MHDVMRNVLCVDDFEMLFKFVVEIIDLRCSSKVCVEEKSILFEHPVDSIEEIVNVSITMR